MATFNKMKRITMILDPINIELIMTTEEAEGLIKALQSAIDTSNKSTDPNLSMFVHEDVTMYVNGEFQDTKTLTFQLTKN